MPFGLLIVMFRRTMLRYLQRERERRGRGEKKERRRRGKEKERKHYL